MFGVTEALAMASNTGMASHNIHTKQKIYTMPRRHLQQVHNPHEQMYRPKKRRQVGFWRKSGTRRAKGVKQPGPIDKHVLKRPRPASLSRSGRHGHFGPCFRIPGLDPWVSKVENHSPQPALRSAALLQGLTRVLRSLRVRRIKSRRKPWNNRSYEIEKTKKHTNDQKTNLYT